MYQRLGPWHIQQPLLNAAVSASLVARRLGEVCQPYSTTAAIQRYVIDYTNLLPAWMPPLE